MGNPDGENRREKSSSAFYPSGSCDSRHKIDVFELQFHVSKAEIFHLLLFPVGCTMRDPECSFSGDIKLVENRFAAPSPSSKECIGH